MICPLCGDATGSSVLRTSDSAIGDRIERVRLCSSCSARFVTCEAPVRVPRTATGSTPVAHRQPIHGPPVRRNNPSTATGSTPVTAGGVGGGLSPIRGSIRDPGLGIQKEGDPDRTGAPLAAVAAPETDPDPPAPRERDPRHPRDAHGLLFLYGIRWEHWQRKKWIGGQWDAKTANHLVDEIRRRCPEGPEREDAFEEVIACIDVFLRLDTPAYAGHKFERFVKELPLLRTGTARRESTSPYCEPHRKDPRRKGVPFVSGCAWCKHHRAAGGQRAGNAVPVGELVATSEAAWTPEQRAEAEQMRATRHAGADRRGAEALRELERRTKTNAGG